MDTSMTSTSELVEQPIAESSTAAAAASETATPAPEGSEAPTTRPRNKRPPPPTAEELEASMRRRVTTIKEGDNVLLRLPSDGIKAVVASRDGLVQLGKYGCFPAWNLLGKHYDITYEIAKTADGSVQAIPEEYASREVAKVPFGQRMSEKNMKKKMKGSVGDKGSRVEGESGGDEGEDVGKGKNGGKGKGASQTQPGWNCFLRPLKRRAIAEAIIEDIQETNEFIDDDDSKLDLLNQDEIAEMRKQGLSAEEIMQKQIERHAEFDKKTDFSKEKWIKRKEKKFSQYVHPLAPTIANITTHYNQRSSSTIMHLREDTMSQLLNLASIRPGGRYLVVDDTGGLVTAAMLDRMACEGRIITFTDSDSPPAWGVLDTMNFSTRELECVKSLSWMEADEDYVKPPPPEEVDMPTVSAIKTQAKLRKYMGQVYRLEETRNELHLGNLDGLIIASQISPISIAARLTPYIIGSGTITVYSPHLQVLVETLDYFKKSQNYLGANLTESWTRTYQVLPGRTHPMMSTSGTGGYLLSATRIHPSTETAEFVPRRKQRKGKKAGEGKPGEGDATANGKSIASDEKTEGGGEDDRSAIPVDEEEEQMGE